MTNNVYPLQRPVLPDSGRNQNFDSFVSSMKELAAQSAIDWEIPLDEKGVALPGTAWDLRNIAKDGRPTSAVLRTLNLFPEGLDAVAVRNPELPRRADGPLPFEWQEFLKSLVLEYLLVRKKSIPFIQSLATAVRFLAAVANKEPWQVTAEDVQLTSDLADARQPSKGTSIVLQGMMTTVVDRLHLADACPLMGLVKRSKNQNDKRSKLYLAQDKLASDLAC